jgi:hypothetical protein
MFLGKRDVCTKIPTKKNGFREQKYNISSPGQGVETTALHQSSSCHNNEVDKGLSPSCLTSG